MPVTISASLTSLYLYKRMASSIMRGSWNAGVEDDGQTGGLSWRKHRRRCDISVVAVACGVMADEDVMSAYVCVTAWRVRATCAVESGVSVTASALLQRHHGGGRKNLLQQMVARRWRRVAAATAGQRLENSVKRRQAKLNSKQSDGVSMSARRQGGGCARLGGATLRRETGGINVAAAGDKPAANLRKSSHRAPH